MFQVKCVYDREKRISFTTSYRISSYMIVRRNVLNSNFILITCAATYRHGSSQLVMERPYTWCHQSQTMIVSTNNLRTQILLECHQRTVRCKGPLPKVRWRIEGGHLKAVSWKSKQHYGFNLRRIIEPAFFFLTRLSVGEKENEETRGEGAN